MEKECCGKHCGEKTGLKKGMGWNRYYITEKEMIKEQLFCQDCYENYTKEHCNSCNELLEYSELKYKIGGVYGNSINPCNQFFCKKCIIDLSKIDYDEDEWR